MRNRNYKNKHIFSKLFLSIKRQIEFIQFLLIFIISINNSFSAYLESFKSESFTEEASLVEINNYYNSSIFMTSRKEIYKGIPPNKVQTASSKIINITSGVNYDNKYLLMACTGDYLLSKINIETGVETPLLNYDNITIPYYTCGVFFDENYAYISMSHIIIPEEIINNGTNNGTNNEVNNETNNETNIDINNQSYTDVYTEINNNTQISDLYFNGTDYSSDLMNNNTNNDTNYDYDYDYNWQDDEDDYSPFLQHSVLRIKLKYDEANGPEIDGENKIDKFIVKYTTKYYSDLPPNSVFSCETINLIDHGSNVVCGYIKTQYGRFSAESIIIGQYFNRTEYSKEIVDLEKISSSIKLKKTNYNKIIVMVSLHCFELSIYREFSRNKLEIVENNYLLRYKSSLDLFFYNGDFLFSSDGVGSSMYIRKNNSFNYFKLKDPLKNITKILGFYDEFNDTLLFIYEFDYNKIIYFTLENISFLYEFKAEHIIDKVLSNTITTHNVSDLIKNPAEHESLELDTITHYINTKDRAKTYDKYNYDNETQNLTIFGSDNDWVTFDFYYEGKKEIEKTDLSYSFHIFNCKITIRTCNFKCGSCNETFDECSSKECKQHFAIKVDDPSNECLSYDQNFFNYKYDKESNIFERCYKTCKFCSIIGLNSSHESHNCLVCDDNYLKSFEHPGNCYQIDTPYNDSQYLKIATHIDDENYTLVDSCPSGKSYKIMDTGECVTSCPLENPYYTYYLNASLNLSAQEENFIGLLYPMSPDRKIPKFKYYKGCYIKCPSYTKENKALNTCDCLYGWNYDEEKNDILCYDNKEYCPGPQYFYHDDTKECKVNNCNETYYKFNFECFINGCPKGTQSDSQDNKKCISTKKYCYINEEFKTICDDTAFPGYPFKYNDTNIYLKDCNDSYYYFNTTTYLYKDVCYILCPEETTENITNGRCSCKYYIHYTNNDQSDYECLKETEKCSDNKRYNISYIQQCVDTSQECVNRGYKVFNFDCLNECPLNSQDSLNNGLCSCQYNYYENDNILNCFASGVTCESLGYSIKMQNSKECFHTEQECINKKHKMFNNTCYESCPDKTEDKNKNGYCLCKDNYFNNSNILNCFESGVTCENKGYNYINLDTKECFNSIEACKDRDLKTFNDDCYSVCPRNTKENSSDTSSCICSYYFFTEPNKKLNCFEQNEVCEAVSENYIYTNTETKECFETIQTCITTGPLKVCISNCNNIDSPTSKCNTVCDPRIDYVFNDICYKFYCPIGTRLNSDDPTNRTCICEEGSNYNEETGLTSCFYSFDDIPIPNKNNCPYFYNKHCEMKCPENTCLNPNTEELNICVDMRPTTKKYNEICIEGIREYTQKITESENDEEIEPIILPSGVTLNAYPAEEDIEELINKYPNLTFVDLGDCKDKLKLAYKLPSDTKLYILGIDTPNLYGNSTINVFNYEIYLKNGTQLDDLSSCNQSKIIISSNINDLDKAHFYKAIEFYKEGYDIYSKSNIFYQDVCSPAQDKGNDITLIDRAKYYYPKDAICNDGCIYTSVNFDQKRFVCKCNANLTEKAYIYGENDSEEKELVTEDEDQTYLEYFLSLINYKIFLCINLFFEFKSFYYNAGFYISFSILLITIALMIVFWTKGINHIRIALYKNIPTKEHLRNLYKKQISRKNEHDLENNKITIYKKKRKKNENNAVKEKDISESKNSMSINNNFLNTLHKNNPPPKRENIIKLKTFLEARKIQKEEAEEPEKEFEINNTNNKDKNKENNDRITDIKSGNFISLHEGDKKIIDTKEKEHKESESFQENLENKKNLQKSKHKTMTLKLKKHSDLLSRNSKIGEEKCIEKESYIDNDNNNEKENISSIKLKIKSPESLLNTKSLDSKYKITLNSENKSNKIEENENKEENDYNYKKRKRKKSRSREKENKTHKGMVNNLFEKDTDINNNLIRNGLRTSNSDNSDLIIDFSFLHLIDRNDEDIDKKEINNVPYLQALRIDKRSYLEIVISVFENEIGFLNIFCYKNPYSHYSLIISVYLFELLLDLAMNCFLYTDDVVSEKYHNDGSLSMFTSLSLSFISNIISSIAVIIISKLTNYHEILELMFSYVKDKKKYFDNIIRISKYIKLRLGIFYFLQLGFIIIMTYYLFIFCAVYHQSQVSITLNYIIGALTSLAISAGLSIIISLLRILSFRYQSNRIYNVSRYLYDNF